MKIIYPDYNNSILNLSNAILKHFGAEYKYNTLNQLDKELEKGYKNVVLMVFDALGSKNIESILPKESFLRRNMISEITSVFPSTTTAAITTLQSGLAPNEHTWLGWNLYFKELDDVVNLFLNTSNRTKERYDFHVGETLIPFKNIVDKVKETGNAEAITIFPFGMHKAKTLNEISDGIKYYCKKEQRQYLFTYWTEPDNSMHYTGIFSEDTKKNMYEIDNFVKCLSEELEDTLLIVTADHGHINSKNELITNYPSITNCLERLPNIEPRALNFYVKKNMNEIFIKEFNKYFGEKFKLLPKEEVINQKLFGNGKDHHRFVEFIGDYVGIAIDDVSIYNTEEQMKKFIGSHAGLTEWEMKVPLILISCN